MKLVSQDIFLYWSESNFINQAYPDADFDINKTINLDEFEKVCQSAAQLVDFGYDKTKFAIWVMDDNGQMSIRELRIDLNKKVCSPKAHIQYYLSI